MSWWLRRHLLIKVTSSANSNYFSGPSWTGANCVTILLSCVIASVRSAGPPPPPFWGRCPDHGCAWVADPSPSPTWGGAQPGRGDCLYMRFFTQKFLNFLNFFCIWCHRFRIFLSINNLRKIYCDWFFKYIFLHYSQIGNVYVRYIYPTNIIFSKPTEGKYDILV